MNQMINFTNTNYEYVRIYPSLEELADLLRYDPDECRYDNKDMKVAFASEWLSEQMYIQFGNKVKNVAFDKEHQIEDVDQLITNPKGYVSKNEVKGQQAISYMKGWNNDIPNNQFVVEMMLDIRKQSATTGWYYHSGTDTYTFANTEKIFVTFADDLRTFMESYFHGLVPEDKCRPKYNIDFKNKKFKDRLQEIYFVHFDEYKKDRKYRYFEYNVEIYQNKIDGTVKAKFLFEDKNTVDRTYDIQLKLSERMMKLGSKAKYASEKFAKIKQDRMLAVEQGKIKEKDIFLK